MPSADMVALAAATLHARRDPERVLEVACEEGERTLFLAREFPRARIRGVDPSPEAVNAATRRVGLDPEGRIAFKVGSADALPLPDEQFDLVVHLGGASAEIARVLRPGGELIAFTDRRLGKHGFQPVQSGGAGGGAYIVARLR